MRHAGPVGIAQELVAHVPGEFERRDFRMRRTHTGKCAIQHGQRAQTIQPHVDRNRVEQVVQFPRHKERTPKQIGAFEAAAILQGARVLRRSESREQWRHADAREPPCKPRVARRPQPARKRGNLAKTRIAGEKFVSPQPGESDLDSRARGRAAHKVRVHAIRAGLIHGCENRLEFGLEVSAPDPIGRMACPASGGGALGKRHLVVRRATILRKAQRKGAKRSTAPSRP